MLNEKKSNKTIPNNIMPAIYFEHVNIVVKNIQETLVFYQTAFPDWKIRGQDISTFYGETRHWLHFGNDYFYLAFVEYPNASIFNHTLEKFEFNHFSFVIPDIKVLTNKMKTEGFIANEGEGSDAIRKNLYFIDPNGYEIEFVEYSTEDLIKRCDY